MKFKKKDHGEDPTLYKEYPIIGILLSRDMWIKLIPSNILVKLDDDEKEDKVIIDYYNETRTKIYQENIHKINYRKGKRLIKKYILGEKKSTADSASAPQKIQK